MDILFTIMVTYFVSIILGWGVHLLLHCKIFGYPFYKFHLLAHHRKKFIANPLDLNLYNIIEHLVWLTFYALFLLIFYLILPPLHFWVSSITFTSYAIVFYIFHDLIHSKDSFLNQYIWFKKVKSRHLLHHRFAGIIEFKKSLKEECPNISFGGPIGGVLLDKLINAYRIK
ncbi:MAG: hypothetical protein LEGION0398_MBIBDBAK_00862 [Legionellaceae bacterium]